MRIRMLRSRPRLAALVAAAALAAVVSAVAATSSQAGSAAAYCPAGSAASKPFLPWGDESSYVLAPDGGLEAGGAGWTLAGGAAVKPGNETFHVRGAGDSHLLDVPAGATATTPPLCIDATMPTMRLFVAGPASKGSTLNVDTEYVAPDGTTGWRKLDKIKTTGGWQAWTAFKLPKKIQSPIVRFRFSVTGGTGGYQVDDVYVDPYIRV